LANKIHLRYLARHEFGVFSVDAVYRSLDRRVAKRLPGLSGLKAVYAYEDGALETFRCAHTLGFRCIYDLPIGYWRVGRGIYREEAALEPEWVPTLQGNVDSEAKPGRKDEELRLADRVIVPSNFVKETLRCAPEVVKSVTVIPFGAPPIAARTESQYSKDKLRVLLCRRSHPA